jgi:hypothetical protein
MILVRIFITEKNCNVNGSSSLFSGTIVEENTMNLSKDLSVDKELFSGERSSKENTTKFFKKYS